MSRILTNYPPGDTTKQTVENKILDAAMAIFSKHGYNGATTIKIAKKADVNEITIFRKFKSKENLLKAVIDKYQMEALETLDFILCKEKSADVEVCVKNLGITLKQFLDERMDFIIMMVIEGRKNPDMKSSLTLFRSKLIEHLREYFQEQMKQGKIRRIDPEVLAFTLFSFLFYASISEIIFEENLLQDDLKTFEEYTDILMRGITITKA